MSICLSKFTLFYFNICHTKGAKWHLIVALIFISLMICEVEHFNAFLLTIFVSLLDKYVSKSFAHLKIRLSSYLSPIYSFIFYWNLWVLYIFWVLTHGWYIRQKTFWWPIFFWWHMAYFLFLHRLLPFTLLIVFLVVQKCVFFKNICGIFLFYLCLSVIFKK